VTNHRRRLVLEMLAEAGEHGRSDPALISRFTPELLDLVRDGLATAEREIMMTDGRPFEIACIRITEKGWRAIEEHVSLSYHQRVDGSAWPLSGCALQATAYFEKAQRRQCGASRPSPGRTCGPVEQSAGIGSIRRPRYSVLTNCTESRASRARRLS
jgi:hypothetical protein